MMNIPSPLIYENDKVSLIDQRKLPLEEIYVEIESIEDCHKAIADMIVRGAPLIGFSALWGAYLWLKKTKNINQQEFMKACTWLKTARPTAVNLAYELDCLVTHLSPLHKAEVSINDLLNSARDFTIGRMNLLEEQNLIMAKLAEKELETICGKKKDFRLMTICNTGYLACGPLGTALGVVSHLHQQAKIEHVFACETRPYLQGARLTAYELDKQEISHQLIVEGAISHVLKNEKIDAVFVGADRIARNGDTANKVGTSTLAICASFYKVPFYVVAPTSSFDIETTQGERIEIEMRDSKEITHWKGDRITSRNTVGYNPSFDVTSSQHITGIFCEKGLIRPSLGADHLVKTVKGS